MKRPLSLLMLSTSLLLTVSFSTTQGLAAPEAAQAAPDVAKEKLFAANRAKAKIAWDKDMKARRMCIDRLEWTSEGPRCLGPTWTPQTLGG